MPEKYFWRSDRGSVFSLDILYRTKLEEEPQGRKCGHSGRIDCCLHLVAKASEFPNHSRSACSLRLCAHSRAAFLVADPLVQDNPDQPTKPMDNGPNGPLVSQA